jgi:hypothetical protein
MPDEEPKVPPAESVDDDAELELDKLPKCPDCGYILYKLARLRCPECGVTIRPEDLFPSEDQIALLRLARRDRIIWRIGMGLFVAGILAIAAACTLGPWHLYTCAIGPLLGFTVIVLWSGWWLASEMHWQWMLLGIVWAFLGGCLLYASL